MGAFEHGTFPLPETAASQAGCLQEKALIALCPSHHLLLSARLSKSTNIDMVPQNVAMQGKFRAATNGLASPKVSCPLLTWHFTKCCAFLLTRDRESDRRLTHSRPQALHVQVAPARDWLLQASPRPLPAHPPPHLLAAGIPGHAMHAVSSAMYIILFSYTLNHAMTLEDIKTWM